MYGKCYEKKVYNNMRTAIYPGSFDPFTNGHLDIVKKAAKLFDKVYVIIGVNAQKKRIYDREEMKLAIEKTLKENGLENCEALVFDGLFAEFAKEIGANYIVRGLRNNTDFDYEENIAEINKILNPDLEYVYLRAYNRAVSSSMVNELSHYCKDVSPFVPEPIYNLMKVL